jgi:hypothetical protein
MYQQPYSFHTSDTPIQNGFFENQLFRRWHGCHVLTGWDAATFLQMSTWEFEIHLRTTDASTWVKAFLAHHSIWMRTYELTKALLSLTSVTTSLEETSNLSYAIILGFCAQYPQWKLPTEWYGNYMRKEAVGNSSTPVLEYWSTPVLIEYRKIYLWL